MARPSLNPLTPKGRLTKLMTKGLLKIGCLRTFAYNVGLVFERLPLTFSQDLSILFQNDKIIIWSLGATNS
jgi:hypothetical protein